MEQHDHGRSACRISRITRVNIEPLSFVRPIGYIAPNGDLLGIVAALYGCIDLGRSADDCAVKVSADRRKCRRDLLGMPAVKDASSSIVLNVVKPKQTMIA